MRREVEERRKGEGRNFLKISYMGGKLDGRRWEKGVEERKE